MNFLKQLKDYFNKTSRDIVEKEYHEFDKYNSVGPTVNEFLKECDKLNKV